MNKQQKAKLFELRIKNTKRGQQTQMGIEFVSIVVGMLLVVALFVFIYRLQGVGKGGLEDTTIKGFLSFGKRVDAVLQNPLQYAVDDKAPYYISDNFVIVGFPQGVNSVKEECYGETIPKPKAQCGDNACLCLYKAYEWEKPRTGCKRLQTNDIFTLDYYDTNTKSCQYGTDNEVCSNFMGYSYNVGGYSFEVKGVKEQVYPNRWQYANFIIYGECDKWWWDAEIEQKQVFIEKYKDYALGKTGLFIGIYDKSFDERFEKFSQAVGVSLARLHELIANNQFITAAKEGHSIAEDFVRQGKKDDAAEAFYLTATALMKIKDSETSLERKAKGDFEEDVEAATAWVLGNIFMEYGASLKHKPEQNKDRLKEIKDNLLGLDLKYASAEIRPGFLPAIAEMLIKDKSFAAAKYLLQYEKYFSGEFTGEEKSNFLGNLRQPMLDYVFDVNNDQQKRVEGASMLISSYSPNEKLPGDEDLANYIRLYGVYWKEWGNAEAEAKIKNELCTETSMAVYEADARVACSDILGLGKEEEEIEEEVSETAIA